ncbi:bifunctional methylenetetrahydrofolate dehydrogenase/methenyltetrahydrofolate cyclohydrolase FolD [Blastopirellula marina]|uniref:Bifunctional protein FolD n=1 Tax=Blastopirellula marina TaxID=124 RepID=A0A2S8F1Z1_9BACT|nr:MULTISPECIES: bifunctional methylenetetrahydrofolate dehydrogenase/methenyltetrahydrofolate cyclohydrolase FolD [Pirellulaceae]PQO26192.1 bifunctional methylenetetrahydrofolate dehydrogenase/methenyltetrahydrofolate cyclohydrolase FolD [Blastopirellula marina]RCS44551.1 bifunctional methylenetetrahydrofolate dehydrogenase/methenyltetrahydrofolate cyclohydrolase FolD [Bremerella cremea]
MTATILDGKTVSNALQDDIAQRVEQFKAKTGVTPCLAAVLVGEDPASQVYVRNKERACEKVGMTSQLIRKSDDISQADLLALVEQLNQDDKVSGILVQLPLPKHVDASKVLDAIDPQKDVDCFHPSNVGLLSQGRPHFLPCTPHGVVQILKHFNLPTAGKNVVILGRSDIVGKPLALMLMQRTSETCGADYANATVTVAHSRTPNLKELTLQADILVAAIGVAKFVTADMVKPGAVVVDVGINRTDDGLCGDVDYDALLEVAGAVTPVPGGVGRLTVTMLMENTLKAAMIQA